MRLRKIAQFAFTVFQIVLAVRVFGRFARTSHGESDRIRSQYAASTGNHDSGSCVE